MKRYTSSANVAASAGSGSVAILTQSWCSWSALRDSSAAWLTITSATSGAGSGSLSYSVTSNNTLNPRTGTLHISGQPLRLLGRDVRPRMSRSAALLISFAHASDRGTVPARIGDHCRTLGMGAVFNSVVTTGTPFLKTISIFPSQAGS